MPFPADTPRRGGRKRPRKSFLLRIPPELMDELRGWAAVELRSLNAHIEYLLREAVRRRRGGAGDEPASGSDGTSPSQPTPDGPEHETEGDP